MSDLGICEYCKYLDKDITQNPCLHCSSNLGAFEFDISEHDKEVRTKVIDEVISRLLSDYEELDNVMVLDIIEGMLEQMKESEE